MCFSHIIPIFASFWFPGLTYGIYMNVSGFSFWFPMIMSLTVFADSVEYVAVNMPSRNRTARLKT